MKISGKLVAVLPPRSGNSNGKDWKVQSFVLECPDGKYSNKVCFEIFGEDKINNSQINTSPNGSEFEVSFSPESREYNGKWFTSLKAYDVRRTSVPQQAPAPQPQAAADGDLPF